jgi:hypothetical protein
VEQTPLSIAEDRPFCGKLRLHPWQIIGKWSPPYATGISPPRCWRTWIRRTSPTLLQKLISMHGNWAALCSSASIDLRDCAAPRMLLLAMQLLTPCGPCNSSRCGLMRRPDGRGMISRTAYTLSAIVQTWRTAFQAYDAINTKSWSSRTIVRANVACVAVVGQARCGFFQTCSMNSARRSDDWSNFVH